MLVRKLWLYGLLLIMGVIWIVLTPMLTNEFTEKYGSIASFFSLIINTSVIGLYLGALHLCWKVLFPYPEADRQTLFKKALESPEGAGFALVGVGLIMVALAMVVTKVVGV